MRLSVKTTSGLTRHLLLTFTPNDEASDGIDYGYDAPNFDNFSNDCNWIIEGKRYVINGVGKFSKNKAYPLGFFLQDSGNISFSLLGLENFEGSVPVFIYDSENSTYHSINDVHFTESIQAGVSIDRFYITFNNVESDIIFVDNDDMLANSNQLERTPDIQYLQQAKTFIFNNLVKTEIKSIELLNLKGQLLQSFDLKNISSQNRLKLNTKILSDGYYVLKITIQDKIFTKKFLIRN